MELTPEQEEKILKMVADEIIERAWAVLEPHIEDVTLMSINRAAGMADLSVSQLNRVMKEWVDFGEQSKRISVAQLRRLIESRTVRKR